MTMVREVYYIRVYDRRSSATPIATVAVDNGRFPTADEIEQTIIAHKGVEAKIDKRYKLGEDDGI